MFQSVSFIWGVMDKVIFNTLAQIHLYEAIHQYLTLDTAAIYRLCNNVFICRSGLKQISPSHFFILVYFYL